MAPHRYLVLFAVAVFVFSVTAGLWLAATVLPIAAQGAATPAAESPLAECEGPVPDAEIVAVPNQESSVVTATGALFGRGPTGVIFSNESGNDPCIWLEFATSLPSEDFTVMIFSYSGWTPASDTVGAVAVMRERGVQSVLLIGSSAGANASLIAGMTVTPPVDGIAAISFGVTPEIEAGAAQLTMPVLLVTSTDDPLTSGNESEEQLFLLLPSERQVLILPGQGHGTILLEGDDGGNVRGVLRAFLDGHAAT